MNKIRIKPDTILSDESRHYLNKLINSLQRLYADDISKFQDLIERLDFQCSELDITNKRLNSIIEEG